MPDPSDAPANPPDLCAALARIQELETALGQNSDRLARTFKLSDGLNNVLGLMMSVDVVDADILQNQMKLTTDAKVCVHRLRRALLPWNVKINQRRGFGWWLTAESKERIANLVGATAPTSIAA